MLPNNFQRFILWSEQINSALNNMWEYFRNVVYLKFARLTAKIDIIYYFSHNFMCFSLWNLSSFLTTCVKPVLCFYLLSVIIY